MPVTEADEVRRAAALIGLGLGGGAVVALAVVALTVLSAVTTVVVLRCVPVRLAQLTWAPCAP